MAKKVSNPIPDNAVKPPPPPSPPMKKGGVTPMPSHPNKSSGVIAMPSCNHNPKPGSIERPENALPLPPVKNPPIIPVNYDFRTVFVAMDSIIEKGKNKQPGYTLGFIHGLINKVMEENGWKKLNNKPKD